jgi:hypothetical protein
MCVSKADALLPTMIFARRIVASAVTVLEETIARQICEEQIDAVSAPDGPSTLSSSASTTRIVKVRKKWERAGTGEEGNVFIGIVNNASFTLTRALSDRSTAISQNSHIVCLSASAITGMLTPNM